MGYVSLNLGRIPLWYFAIAGTILFGFFLKTRKISFSLLITYMFLVFVATFLARKSSLTVQYEFSPFASYRRALISKDMWWSVVCNIMMSVPIGFLSPIAMYKDIRNVKKLLITLLVGIIFSVCIEVLQFVFQRGYSETDDIISSVIGLIIGFNFFILTEMIISWVRKK